MGSDTELSSMSEDEKPQALTAAEKARRTRKINQDKELADNDSEALAAETANGRQAKKDALTNKIWDSEKSNRKRAASSASTADAPPKSKKSKSVAAPGKGRDAVLSHKAAASQSQSKKGSQSSSKSQSKTGGTSLKHGAQAIVPSSKSTRKHLPPSNPLASDESDEEDKIKQPRRKKSTPAIIMDSDESDAGKSAKTSVPKKPSNTEGEDDLMSAEDDQSDRAEVSDADDGLNGDQEEVERRLLEERPHIVRKVPIPTDEEEQKPLDFDPSLLPSLYSHRQQSSSSFGGSDYDIPAETDFDEEDVVIKEDNDSDLDENVSKGKKKSVQQQKYEAERPQVRQSKSSRTRETSKDTGYNETDWPQPVRLVFPRSGGLLKLLEQRLIVQDIIREAMELGLHDIAFKNGYAPIASRAGDTQVLLRRAAKKLGDRATLAGTRAKYDLEFCRHLAPLIFARFGKLRNDVRNSALKVTAAHYELTKPGITPRQVRLKIRALEKDQKFIYPYHPDHPFPDGAAVDDASDVAVSRVKDDRFDKCFKANAPFLAPAIADVIHDVWFSNAKAFGFKDKSVKAMVSRIKSLPSEKELPSAMICLATTNILGALQTYSTGVYMPAPEFSQSRLESTYLSLIEFINTQYDDDEKNVANAKAFHKIMHRLYLNASKSVGTSASAPSGSAANIVRLDLDDD